MRLSPLLYLLLLQSLACAGGKLKCVTERNDEGEITMYRTIQWWEFDDYKVDGLTLSDAMKKFRANSGPENDPWDRVNVVVKWSQLTDVQKNSKIYMDGTGYSASDIIHVIAMTLGLGYKVEEHAVLLGSRENYPLPKTKSTTLGAMLESIRTEPKILIRYTE